MLWKQARQEHRALIINRESTAGWGYKIKNKNHLFPQPEIHRDQRLTIEYNDIKL
jgi:hypothetical protein